MAAQTAGVPAFVFIMFGHNDQKKVTDTDGPDYLTFADHNQNGTVAGTYYDYLERYIVETRELGGIPILFTPFVREYLEGAPSTVTIAGQHNITAPYAGETAARGDYPAAAKAIAAKHDVPIVDITSWSKTMVEAHAAASSLALRLHLGRSDPRAEPGRAADGRGGGPGAERAGDPDRLRQAVDGALDDGHQHAGVRRASIRATCSTGRS